MTKTIATEPYLRALEIVYEDNELLVVNKSAGLVCHPTKGDAYSSLVSRLRLYLSSERVHLINRLDRETSGIVVAAKEDRTAKELHGLWEARLVDKEYWAVVHGHWVETHGIIEEPLGRDETSSVIIKDQVRPDGATARTEFELVSHFAFLGRPVSWLRVWPRTGRKHQIRIHLAHRGHAIVGDKLYGGDEDCYLALVEGRLTVEQRRQLMIPEHALHAREVQFTWRGERRRFTGEAGEVLRSVLTRSSEFNQRPKDGPRFRG